MTLIVEDGTGLPDANTYASLATASAFLGVVGNVAWLNFGPADQEAMLAQGFLIVNDASTYVYDGNQATFGQAGAWPRIGADYWHDGPAVPPNNTIPPEMIRANIMAAGGIADGSIKLGSAAGQPGQPSPTGLVKSKTVDVLKTEYFSPKEAQTDGQIHGAYKGLGWPVITGIVAALLDEAFYGIQSEGMTMTPARAATLGPAFTTPAYGGLWQVGMNDDVQDASDDLLSPG